jgi:hypothetical protein
MNTDHIQSIHTTQTALTQTGSTALREGSSVSGRVLQKTGPQSYVVSLAGHQIEVRSEQNLVPGATFTAKIAVRGENVALVLQHAGAAAETGEQGASGTGESSLVTKFTAFSLFADGTQNAAQSQSTALSQMMSQLGLPLTPAAVHLVQLAQELGVKIKPESIKKALAQSLSFTGSEEEAAATSLLLEEKGLCSGEGAVRAVFDGSGHGSKGGREAGGGNSRGTGCGHGSRTGSGSENSGISSDCTTGTSPAADEDSSFISAYVESADDAAVSNKRGALTVFNMLEPGCIVLPFEWERFKSYGVIRVFHLKFVQKPKKIAVECQTSLKKYIFMLYFSLGKVEKVVYRIMPPVPCEQQKMYSGMLEQMMFSCAAAGSHIPVTYTDSELFSGFCAADVPLSAAKGDA